MLLHCRLQTDAGGKEETLDLQVTPALYKRSDFYTQVGYFANMQTEIQSSRPGFTSRKRFMRRILNELSFYLNQEK